MKTMKNIFFVAIILVLALSVMLGFDTSFVANAVGTESVETFFFNYDNGQFTLTRNSTNEVVYRSATYVTDDIVQAIKDARLKCEDLKKKSGATSKQKTKKKSK